MDTSKFFNKEEQKNINNNQKTCEECKFFIGQKCHQYGKYLCKMCIKKLDQHSDEKGAEQREQMLRHELKINNLENYFEERICQQYIRPHRNGLRKGTIKLKNIIKTLKYKAADDRIWETKRIIEAELRQKLIENNLEMYFGDALLDIINVRYDRSKFNFDKIIRKIKLSSEFKSQDSDED